MQDEVTRDDGAKDGTIPLMLVFDFFQWWYGRGWRGVFTSNHRRLTELAGAFSIGLLLRTLFAPWRRIVTTPGADPGLRLQALGDNLISRLVGFVVRFFVLLAAGVMFLLLAVGTAIETIVWPFFPLAAVACVIWGLL